MAGYNRKKVIPGGFRTRPSTSRSSTTLSQCTTRRSRQTGTTVERPGRRLERKETMTTIGAVCSRDVVFTTRDATVAATAMLMRQNHVGCVVVVEQLNGGKRLPIGMVTDRDIVIEVIAPGLDVDTITAGDIMTTELVTVAESEGLLETMEIMRYKGVRRIPVVDSNGQLVGIASIDDLLEVLAEELSELAKIVSRERVHEVQARK